ncbi:hypothetical protein BEP19_14200 [Ammoniphilus oxalaticus]|uniref:HTH merR-type domain-containing protein n=1 Tax=Ammoniphilus oxalaticus TaxID=66863 RepID=A0A419SF64_9BACL|nr:MerR family transcriptional regulator [Ammoniphilus oxalaticus]RKD21770.1 hypothetical protein BEP19_14200 [Ammoniphilus oxalaticus]
MAEQWYSLKDMAKELNTTWQSVRSWKDQFYQFVPMDIEGKQVRFKKDALVVFQFIQEARDNGLDQHDIREGLGEKFGQAEHSLIQAGISVGDLAIDSKMIEEMKQTIELLQHEIADLKTRMQEVEIAKRDQELMDNLGKIREEREKKKKGIWSRVMNFTL